MDKIYWENFYKENNILRPSQFASFVANEFNFNSNIVEIGSGSGRDAFFLSHYYENIISIDQSSSAISNQMDYSRLNKLSNINFICEKICSNKVLSKCEQFINKELPVVIYSRFFIHAINEEEEKCFFDFVKSISKYKKIYLALEYRNTNDQNKIKVTDDHYRRYINDNEIAEKYRDLDLSIIFTISGTGFAKYKQDDAFVTRTLLENHFNG